MLLRETSIGRTDRTQTASCNPDHLLGAPALLPTLRVVLVHVATPVAAAVGRQRDLRQRSRGSSDTARHRRKRAGCLLGTGAKKNGMTAIARLGGVSLDSADPARLADFYRQLLGLDVFLETDDFVALKGAGILITAQRVEGHVPATWPDGLVPKQLHLELAVDDLDSAETMALALGAIRAIQQPAPDQWRVLIDPAGHPFCMTILIPKD